jgi:hypothetical protein
VSGGTIANQDDVSIHETRVVRIATTAAVNSAGIILTEGGFLGTDDRIVVAEWDASVSSTGADVFAFQMGFQASGQAETLLSKNSGSNALLATTRASAGSIESDIATGFTMIQNTKHRFRIECHGANMPGGARTLYFADGVLIYESALVMKGAPTAAPWRVLAVNASGAASGARVFKHGPLRIVFNREKSMDLL